MFRQRKMGTLHTFRCYLIPRFSVGCLVPQLVIIDGSSNLGCYVV